MKKLKQRPLRSVFLLAAKKQFEVMENGYDYGRKRFACLNLSYASMELRNSGYDTQTPERDFFSSLYEEDCDEEAYYWTGSWWDNRNGEFDHESRIFALLFAAEILRR